MVPLTTDPKAVEVISTLTANLAFAGITCPVAHFSYSSVWFLWKNERSAVAKHVDLARSWQKLVVPSVSSSFESRTGVRKGATDYDLDASGTSTKLRRLSDALWLTWSTHSDGRHMTVDDFISMVNFITKKDNTSEGEAVTLMSKIEPEATASSTIGKTAAFGTHFIDFAPHSSCFSVSLY